MKRFLLVAAGLVICVTSIAHVACAHFTYLVPSADRLKLQIIFSDSLEPDKNASIDKILKTTLFTVDGTGKQAPVKWTKSENAFLADLPSRDIRVVAGVTDYGFHQSKHTQNKPVWLKYYPKAILGDVSATESGQLVEKVPLEISPLVSGGQITFQARWKGKPLADGEFGVLVPGESAGQKIASDSNGTIKAQFDKPGRYGVRVGYFERIDGELDGNRYVEIRHYATLVVDFAPAGR
jgi:uncharacterized GH25 family protein